MVVVRLHTAVRSANGNTGRSTRKVASKSTNKLLQQLPLPARESAMMMLKKFKFCGEPTIFRLSFSI